MWVASDDCSSWRVLLSVGDAYLTKPGPETKAWDIPHHWQKAYECYGLKIIATNQRSAAVLANIKMFTETPLSLYCGN